jgi:hypothetical protein
VTYRQRAWLAIVAGLVMFWATVWFGFTTVIR